MSDMLARAVEVTYTNWRGETRRRRVVPLSIRWGVTEWHPTPGWLLRAFDPEKGEEREFDLGACDFTAAETPEGATG